LKIEEPREQIPVIDSSKILSGLISDAERLSKEGKFNESIAKWDEVLNHDRNNEIAKEGIKKTKDLIEAKEKKKQILILNEEAKNLFKKGDFADSIAKWRELLILDPINSVAIAGIKEAEKILKERGEENEKIEIIKRSAMQLYNKGKYSEAIDNWKQVLAIDPGNQIAIEEIDKAERELAKKTGQKKVLKYCPDCGSEYEFGWKYCEKCGFRLDESNYLERERFFDRLKELKKSSQGVLDVRKYSGSIEKLKDFSLGHKNKTYVEGLANAETEKKYCPKCGTPFMLGDKYCENCGIKLT